mgnify:CR=1 FL=1
MKIYKFKSIQTRLTFWFLVLTLIPLLCVLTITYFQRVNVIETSTFDKLVAIRDLKVERLHDWLTERVGDLRTISADKELADLQYIIQPTNNGHNKNEIITIVRTILNRYLSNSPSYYMLFVVNPITAKILVSTEKNLEGIEIRNEDFFTVPMATGELSLTEIYFSNTLGEYTMDYSIPIYGTDDKRDQIVGILVAKTNLKNTLFQQLLDRVGLGETGETLIVNEDALALNELRWQADAPLKLHINAAPALAAASGKTGIDITTDYRGEEVLAAYTYFPETGWGFVCKQDLRELNAPIRDMMWSLLIIFFIITIVILPVAWYIGKSFSKPIVEMDRVAQKFGGGDLSMRNKITSEDESGSLALEFNRMADTIASKLKIQQRVQDISETLIKPASMMEFGSELLRKLMEISGATMSAFYILNEVTGEYEHFTSIGANEKALKSFSVESLEGEIGNAISTKGLYYLLNIPKTTIFNYKTIAGEAIPKEIVTIPILNDDNVIAIISLINIHSFDNDIIEMLKISWNGISTSYSNLMSGERTRIFAEQLSISNQNLEAKSEELQKQTEELQNQAIELQRTSDELQEQYIELDSQKIQVELANKLKSEFLSNMSHELRTPLNSIMALSNVLISQTKNKLDNEEINYLNIVERSGKRLLLLINDILDLSKIEAGKMEIIPESISVKAILQSIIDNFYTISEEKGLKLSLELPENLPSIENDELKLYQVISNIVSNAVKFTKKGGISISVKHDQENVTIEVKDTGIGIAEDVLPYVFDEFRQADGTTSRQYEGTGLGLTIASKMTKILGGKIDVSSKLNKGTVFTVTIPIRWHEEIQQNYLADSGNKMGTQIGKKILVVDDDEKIVKNICKYLKEEGYETISSTSGKEAIKLAEKYQPVAITLDIVMPDMDGWEVLQKLKSNTLTKNIPVIIVSVSEDKETGFALGAMGYISKPIDKELFLAEIKQINKNPKSVMIVDDNEVDLNQMAEILKAEKINTIRANGGEECIKLLKDKIPDILVLDLMMPVVDGFQVLSNIRKNSATLNLPVIIVTAKDLTKEDKAKLAGKVSSVISKSDVAPIELNREIKRIISELERQPGKAKSKEDSTPHILLVEDNEDAIVQMKLVLEHENYSYDVAKSGKEALDFMIHKVPDGIILDLMMPDIDGFEVLEKLRSSYKTKNTPVLVLTAKDLTRKDLARLSSNNIQQLIIKGDVDISGLVSKIKLMLGIEPRVGRKSEEPTPEPFALKENRSQYQNFNKSVKKDSKNTSLPKVLVVEDNKDNMITIKAILGEEYIISEAVDGEQALSLAKSIIPNLILLDMSLPKIDGEEVVRILRSSKETANIPIIAVTAQAMIGDKEHFINLGCDGYVSKPIDLVLIRKEIGKVMW